MKLLNILAIFFCLLCAQTTAAAATPAETLADKLKPLVTSAGEFEQIATDGTGEVVQESSGTFAVQQPGKFLWHTIEPFEQLLVSDGETIWLHDPDLEQVTVKPFNDNQNQLPIRILSGEFELLDSEFTIETSESKQTVRFHLTPREASNIQSIDLVFSDDDLQSMSVTDHADTQTQFRFANRRALNDDDIQAFDFQIPEGADVFHDQ